MFQLYQLGIWSTADVVVTPVLATDNSRLKTLQTTVWLWRCCTGKATHDERLLLNGLSADNGYMHNTHCDNCHETTRSITYRTALLVFCVNLPGYIFGTMYTLPSSTHTLVSVGCLRCRFCACKKKWCRYVTCSAIILEKSKVAKPAWSPVCAPFVF